MISRRSHPREPQALDHVVMVVAPRYQVYLRMLRAYHKPLSDNLPSVAISLLPNKRTLMALVRAPSRCSQTPQNAFPMQHLPTTLSVGRRGRGRALVLRHRK